MKLLNDMALFVEVIKANSFRGAAEAVGLPNSTVSRRIAELERRIGLRLLNRTTRRIELTEGGRLYYERCRRIVDEARLAEIAVQLGISTEKVKYRFKRASAHFRRALLEHLPRAEAVE